MKSVNIASVGVLAIGLLLTAGVFAGAPTARATPDALAGKVIVLDPGHQLGNSNPRFAAQIAETKFNGSLRKGCNTTGTATNAGLPEATFNWRVAQRLKGILEERGAKVVMTRDSNSRDSWGPCIWDRARIANEAKADAMISIHADGAPAASKGFFAIVPTKIKGWTADVVVEDRRLSKSMVAGMKRAGAPPANYVRDQIMVSPIMSTLNFSDVPTTIVELGNMRNASDARRMSTASGQRQYADWLLAGLERFFS